MARKTASRLELRKQAEAAEKRDASGEKKKTTRKKTTTTRAKRTKTVTQVRKRVVWAIYSGSMKEEARFPYAERAQAEEKLEQLRSKGKKMYFMQPLKEDMADGGSTTAAAKAKKAKAVKPAKKKAKSEEEE